MSTSGSMATLGEIYHIPIPIIKGNDIEIESSDLHRTVVATIDRKHVVIFNIHDQQVVTDWTVGGQQLSCPAVIHGDEPELSVLLGCDTVCTWQQSASRLEKGHKQTVSEPVYGLWVPLGSSCPYILHGNGALRSLDDPDTIIIPHQLPPGASIVWRGQITEETCNVMCIVYLDKKHLATCLVYNYQSSSKTVRCTKRSIPSMEAGHNISYSICHHATEAYLFILDSSFGLRRLCVFGKGVRDNIECLNKIPNISEKTAICALDSHQVAVVGIKGPDGTVGLATWDTKFGLMYSYKPLKKSKPHQRLFRIGLRLYIPCADGLYACSYTPHSGTLSKAMGALLPTTIMTSKCMKHTESIHDDDLAEVQQMLRILADSKEAQTSKKFKMNLVLCIKWLKTAAPEDLDILETEITMLVQRIADKSNTLSDSVFDALLDGHALQASHLVLLMPRLMEHKKTELIHKSMVNVHYVTESVIIQVLSYYIRTLPKEDMMEMDDSDSETQTEGTLCLYKDSDAAYINTVLQLPFNSVFLVDCLKSMDFSLVIDLLKYLAYLLPWVPAAPSLAKIKGVPVLSQVFDWCCMCLDAHLSQLVISADAKPVIFTLTEQVKHQITFCEELGSLDSILKQLKQKWTQKPKHGAKHYCIQTLHVK